MEFKETPLEGLWIVEPKVFGDARGFFMETYSEASFGKRGLCTNWAQDNHSLSSKGVIRGLHFQNGIHAQIKLVRIVRGAVLDVAVDIRPESKTFGQHFSIELSEDNRKALYIPQGFAHGFSVLSENAELCYKCSGLYAPQAEGGIVWNDPDLNIDWKVEALSISEKDKVLPTLAKLKQSLGL